MTLSNRCLTLTDANFKTEVLDADGVVVVYFWADWSGPCHMMGPLIEHLTTQYEGVIKMAHCDLDSHISLAVEYGVETVPTLLLFKAGQMVDQIKGTASRKEIVTQLNALLLA